MRRGVGAWLGSAILVMLAGVLLLGAFWTPYDPLAIDLGHVLAAPDARHWFGTDEFGRDVASRAMLGARISLTIAFETTCLAIVLGSALGVLSGFVRGWLDRIIMTIADAVLAFPAMLLALALVAVFGGSGQAIVLALGIAYLPATVRVVRAAVLSIREKEYVEAARVAGDGPLRIMLRHVLPNALGPIVILSTSLFGWVILYESALSFLGVGVPPPAPTWGNMLSSARPYLEIASWLSLAPGLCIVITLLGVNLAGDALRDHFDPGERR